MTGREVTTSISPPALRGRNFDHHRRSRQFLVQDPVGPTGRLLKSPRAVVVIRRSRTRVPCNLEPSYCPAPDAQTHVESGSPMVWATLPVSTINRATWLMRAASEGAARVHSKRAAACEGDMVPKENKKCVEVANSKFEHKRCGQKGIRCRIMIGNY